MEDTNEKGQLKENEEGKKKKWIFNGLQWVYVIKTIVFGGIAICTNLFCDNFKSLLTSAFIFLFGICFDFFISIQASGGPVLKVRRFVSCLMFVLVLIALVALFIGILSVDRITKDLQSHLYTLLWIFTIGAGIISPMIETVSCLKKND